MQQSFPDRFIPDQLRKDFAVYGKAKLLVGFAFALIVTALIFIGINLSLGIFDGVVVLIGSIILFSIPSLFLLKWSRSLMVAGNWLTFGVFIVIANLSFTQGGLETTTAWASLIPVIATLLGNVRTGIFWGSMSAVLLVGCQKKF